MKIATILFRILAPFRVGVILLLFVSHTHAQIITTIAGNGTGLGNGGLAVDCELHFPYSTAIDAAGNIYIADAGNNRVRKIDIAGIMYPPGQVHIVSRLSGSYFC